MLSLNILYYFAFSDSDAFEDFVDNELDGDISELDITDDEDADPNFEVDAATERRENESSSDESDEEPISTTPRMATRITALSPPAIPSTSARSPSTSQNNLLGKYKKYILPIYCMHNSKSI